jgi:hypothetical protein
LLVFPTLEALKPIYFGFTGLYYLDIVGISHGNKSTYSPMEYIIDEEMRIKSIIARCYFYVLFRQYYKTFMCLLMIHEALQRFKLLEILISRVSEN